MKNCLRHAKVFRRRSGLTLLELVIVLVILAALTGIAVQSIEPIADQSRYESTQQTLEEIRDAIQSRDVSNGSVSFAGFISDMGRLPVGVIVDKGTDQERLEPVELWRGDLSSFDSTDLWPYTPASPLPDPFVSDGDVTVRVSAGWRGPYIQLPPGATSLRDGYGNPFQVKTDEIDQIVNLQSLGAVLTDDSDNLSLPSETFGPNRITASLEVTVREVGGEPVDFFMDDADNVPDYRLFVRVYGPTIPLGEPGILANAELVGDGVGVLQDSTGVDYRISCGIRTVSAVLVESDSVSDVATPPSPPTETAVRWSSPRQLVISPGTTVLPVLYLDRS